MKSLSNDAIENYIQRVTELSQSHQRIPTATELEKIAADLGIGLEEIEAAQKQSQDHFTRAQGYLRLQHWDDAIEELQEALAFCPFNGDMLLSLASAYLGRWQQKHRRNDAENVRLRVRQCLSLQPDSQEALNLLAKLDRARQWHRTVSIGLIVALGSFLTTSTLLTFWPESLGESLAAFFNRQSRLENLEKQMQGEINALELEQEQLREEMLSQQTRESQRYQRAIDQLQQRLIELEKAQEALIFKLQEYESKLSEPTPQNSP